MPGPSQPHETAQVQRYVLEGFTGGLHSENTFSKTQMSDLDAAEALNVEFWPVGTVSKRKGRQKKNTANPLDGPITCLYQWWSEAGGDYLMAFSAATTAGSAEIHYFEPDSQTEGTFTSILSAGEAAWNPGEDDVVRVETFGGSAVFVDGKDELFAWDGAACEAVSAAPNGAVAIMGYKNYLFLANTEPVGGGTRHNSRIWWSAPGDAHTWPADNYMDLDAQDGDYITGMEIVGNELIVFKERKIFAISYVGGLYEFVSEIRQTGVGCAAGKSIIPVFGELLFYGVENFYSFNGRDIESLTDKIKDLIVDEIIPESREHICGEIYEERNQVWWTVPMDSDNPTENSHIMVLDFETNALSFFTGSFASLTWYISTTDLTFGDLTESYSSYDATWGNRLFLSNAAIILAGTYDGYIVDCTSSGTESDMGANYTGRWRSRWIDFGMPDITKRITRISFLVDREVESPSPGYNLVVTVRTDWDTTVKYEKYLSLLGTVPVLERRLDFTFQCRALQIAFSTTAKDRPFRVHKIVIEYIPKGRTLVV